ncbi:MAG: alpha/beta fold hydrolase [Candidatus Saccharimonadales bacterium]
MDIFNKIWQQFFKQPQKLAKTVDAGQGRPVLLIHGLASSGQTWEPLVDVADKTKWRLIGFDLLGFGASPKPLDNSYDVDEHANAILSSLDRKAKKQKLIIIGHSMGCLVAAHIAALRPAMLEHLILYEPPLFADSPEFRSHARRKRLYFAFYEQLLRQPKIMFKYSKIMGRLAEGRVLAVTPNSWLPFERSLKNTVMQPKAYNDLKHTRTPTDIIYGKFDLVVTRADVKKMLQANPHITFHMVREMHDVTPRAAKYINRLLKQLY